jgi:hypothetical protein
MTKWNGIERNKKPRQISKKKLAKLLREKEVREKIRTRAGNSCEICGLGVTPPTYKFEIHELIFRSALGKVSEENSRQACSLCHMILQRYILHDKAQCIRTIISMRKVSEYSAQAIYDKICQFANKHGLLRESKVKIHES